MSTNRVLVIVESPNKCKTIKQFLPSNYIVMASVGHISEIKDGGSYYNTGIEPNENFKTNYVVSSDKKDVVSKLKEEVSKADTVYICSDPDREGEAIAWSLKKFLKIPASKLRRATFHEITKNAVLQALEHPSKIDDDLVEAAQSRQQLDKMLGYRLSPIARRSIGAKSVGRCQSAGLKILVDRELEIKNFKSEIYYDLILHFTKNLHQYKAKYVGTSKRAVKRLDSEEKMKKIANNCKGHDYIISNITTKDKVSNPKPPFTTSTFQQEVSSKLGVSVKTAMSYAQKLFEGIDINGNHVALITYIRTDCLEFAPEFIPTLESFVKTKYGIKYYAPLRKVKKSENAQEGHEAIRPVDLELTPEKLGKLITDKTLLKVYGIIYNRTVATSMASSITSETTYEILNNDEKFSFSSNELKFDGYKKVYAYTDGENDELAKDTFTKDEKLQNTSLEGLEKSTQPPARYKEATFIKELESSGIGRPSTFATIVSTLLDSSRGYSTTENGVIIPTEKGIQLSQFLDKEFPNLINVNYTSELEKQLDLIASGKITRLDFLSTFYHTLEENAKIASKLTPNAKRERIIAEGITCPECGSAMYLRNGPYGEFYGCSKYPKCKGIVKKK